MRISVYGFGAFVILLLLLMCNNETPVSVPPEKEYDKRLLGTYACNLNFRGNLSSDTLIFFDVTYYMKSRSYYTSGWPTFDTIGYSTVLNMGNWYTRNDSLFFKTTSSLYYDTLGKLTNMSANSDAELGLRGTPYLFNSATELWIWNGYNKKIWERKQ